MDEEDRAAAGTEHPYLSGERLQCAVKIGCPYSLLMSRDFDYRAEAEVAMREAAAATTAVERIKWVRLALAWQDLARSGEGQDGVARWVTKRLITERHLREAHRLGWRCLREPAQHGSVPEQ